MCDIIKVFWERRSIRSYAETQIPDELLRRIVREGYYSPNAGNKQLLRMVVCRNREINEYLGKLKHLAVERLWNPEKGDYKAIRDEELVEQGISSLNYGAPVVVFLFGPKDFEFAEADAYIMANNLCLIARNYDVGSVILSGALDYFVTERSRRIMKDWEIPEDYVIRAHAALGYPKDGFPEARTHDKYVPPLFAD